MSIEAHNAMIIGAGPAGLATSRELSRAGVDHVVLERGSSIGHTWANLYDGLVLHTGKHLSALPGMPFPGSTPVFPTRVDFLEYLHRYADTCRAPVQTGQEVESVALDREWTVHVKGRPSVRARNLVIATGIVSNPHVPDFAGRTEFRGTIRHSVAYRRPDAFTGARVLVVGGGNSAGEICAELAQAGVDVTVSMRSGATVVPRELLGIPIQYFGVALNALPRPLLKAAMATTSKLSEQFRGTSPLPRAADKPCPNVPLIGFHLADGVRAGTIRLRSGISDFTADGVRFADGLVEPFDHVILATGYRAALGMLSTLVGVDDCGFALRRERVISADRPHLYFVGHSYDASGGLRNIARDARIAASLIARR
jgi:cation diffusion facilitator CzcD-associated flavoprotein CzcO